MMNVKDTRNLLESLFLAADTPLTIGALIDLLPEIDRHTIMQAIDDLQAQYQGFNSGIHLMKVAGGYQFRTSPDNRTYIQRLYEAKPVRLSRAAMETLAIIAYRQPITRAQIEEIRGVDCSGVTRTLSDHDLVHVVGRLDDIGKPNLYGTTEYFLEFFALESLEDLPTLDEQEQQVLEEMRVELQQG